ncbi:hypothetical protein [Paraglaciecola arctica]|uniref:hypothetical protein n=1 Tax=Paraglaciecola arctica TaxID=1128911 RepID=UPI001C07607C|nr:hypothetical protein [Paraglaciecola arctica]MBU3005741.1 hypothetical protein [Paraglaciecola arctica]
MKPFQELVLYAGLGLSLLACGSSDGGSTSNKLVDIPTAIETLNEDIQVLFEEDIAEDIRQSVPSDINLPLGLQATLDIEYLGAFRVVAEGQSNSNYAVGTLGFNPDNNSIFMAGHAYHNAIAEFEVPSHFSFETQAANIPAAAVLQDYVQILNKKEIGNTNNKINGILYHDQNLLVSSEVWYDASGSNADNLQVFSNALDVSSSSYKGMLQLEGKAKAAGYMFKVPNELTEQVGSEYLVGWATNYSIVSRYSQGPSLYRFDPEQAIDSVLSVNRTIDTDELMVFPFAEDKQLVEGSDLYTLDISPIWGPTTKAKFGFIIPGTSYFLAVGQHSGLHSGIGYKITQNNGNLCGGPCPFDSDDVYNYFWLFDVNEMLAADEPWLVQPISYGKWSHPYDKGGARPVSGGTYDDQNNILYLSIEGAGQTGDYDRPPLIISYKLAKLAAKQ